MSIQPGITMAVVVLMLLQFPLDFKIILEEFNKLINDNKKMNANLKL